MKITSPPSFYYFRLNFARFRRSNFLATQIMIKASTSTIPIRAKVKRLGLLNKANGL